MYDIVKKERLNDSVTLIDVYAPLVALHAAPGQFIILRVDGDGERIPFTVADYDHERGTVTIVFQIVGATTEKLNHLEVGDHLHDFVGPLGKPTDISGVKSAAVIGGGLGCAIAYPVAKLLYDSGCTVDSVIGFRTGELVFMESHFKRISRNFRLMTDDGTAGEKGLVTNALLVLLEDGVQYDEVFAVGPLSMMKYVSLLTKKFGVKTTVSMNPIMIDGTGMCGCCRLTVGGEVKFACVDGPEFDGHLVDFDEAMQRAVAYHEFEHEAREKTCRLFRKAGM